MKEGIIVKGYGGFFFVLSDGEIWRCRGSGRLRYEEQHLLAGDHVQFEPLGADEGVIKKVLPRRNMLIRPPVANVDQAIIVFSLAQPEPDLILLDRLLVLCGYEGIDAVICFNKIDLVSSETASDFAGIYQKLGYPTVLTSATLGEGIEDLRKLLKDKISVFAGPSGVGKSSLLNSLEPGLSLKTGEVSRKLRRGRHTTRHVELLSVGGGLVADTPGFSNLELPQMKSTELGLYFPEIRELTAGCRFSDCLHLGEPDCMVKKALADGSLIASRYQNYLKLLSEIMQKERNYK